MTSPPATASDTGTGTDTSTPITTGDWLQVEAGFAFTCGIRADRSAECWGSDRYLGPHEPHAGPFQSIAVGSIQACGLLLDGTIECWGCQDSMIGEPVCSPPAGEFTELVSDLHSACARKPDGLWTCWGTIEQGPVPPTPQLPFIQVDASQYLLCAIPDEGLDPVCWGEFRDWSNQEPPPGIELSRIAVGINHACGLNLDGQPLCWGVDQHIEPYVQPPPGTFVEIYAEEAITCGLTADGTADCWAPDYVVDDGFPLDPPEGTVLEQISVGNTHMCGLTPEGDIVCWGGDRAGEFEIPE